MQHTTPYIEIGCNADRIHTFPKIANYYAGYTLQDAIDEYTTYRLFEMAGQ